jgi:hypothetical protein
MHYWQRYDAVRHQPYHHYTLEDLAFIHKSNSGTKPFASLPTSLPAARAQLITEIRVDLGC